MHTGHVGRSGRAAGAALGMGLSDFKWARDAAAGCGPSLSSSTNLTFVTGSIFRIQEEDAAIEVPLVCCKMSCIGVNLGDSRSRISAGPFSARFVMITPRMVHPSREEWILGNKSLAKFALAGCLIQKEEPEVFLEEMCFSRHFSVI
jgi:hypothetical protein